MTLPKRGLGIALLAMVAVPLVPSSMADEPRLGEAETIGAWYPWPIGRDIEEILWMPPSPTRDAKMAKMMDDAQIVWNAFLSNPTAASFSANFTRVESVGISIDAPCLAQSQIDCREVCVMDATNRVALPRVRTSFPLEIELTGMKRYSTSEDYRLGLELFNGYGLANTRIVARPDLATLATCA